MVKNMTKGNPAKILFYFALPMILGNVIQQLYNIVDSMIVGNFLGADKLAAVGASYPITFVFITIANGASIGCGVLISQYFGSKNIEKMKTAIYTSLISIFVFSFILTIMGLVFCNTILKLMNIPSNIFYDCHGYINIYFMGIVFLFLYNISNASFNALGNSKTPLIFLIISSVLNIFLDLLFVLKFNLAVRGVAYATLIAQGFSAILSLSYLLIKIRNIKSNNKYKLFDFVMLKKISKVALPSILQQSIVSIGNLFVQSLVNSYGSIVIAGYTSASKIDSICILPLTSLSNAMSTFTAQNIGGKKSERVKKGYKAALSMIAVFCIFAAIILFIFGNSLVGIFVDSSSNQNVISVGHEYLKIVSIFYFLMGLMVTTNGVLRGAGDLKIFLISSLANLSTRVICAYALASFIGRSAIWWAVPLGWIIASAISVVRYRSGKWREKKMV